MKNLFDDTILDLPNNQNFIEGPGILNEVLHSIFLSPTEKTPGPERIPVKIVKLIEDGNIKHITKFQFNVKHSYNSRRFVKIDIRVNPKET